MTAKRNVVLLIGTIVTVFSAQWVGAQAVDQIVAAEERRIQQAQAAQDAIDEGEEQTRDLTEEYRAVMKEVDGLVVYNTLLDRQIADQNTELDNLRTSIDSVTVIERQILPLLTRMIEGLEQFVSLDMPFLEDERRSRVANLQALLERADVTAAEKFRVVMEAWQIENEYGRTIEAYTGELELDGNVREVDFLRIGRVALIYQTPDGVNSGTWSTSERAFVPVDGGFRNAIRQGLRLARNQVSPDLLLLPIAAPEEG